MNKELFALKQKGIQKGRQKEFIIEATITFEF
jgi:hypothetical protein